ILAAEYPPGRRLFWVIAAAIRLADRDRTQPHCLTLLELARQRECLAEHVERFRDSIALAAELPLLDIDDAAIKRDGFAMLPLVEQHVGQVLQHGTELG